MSKLISGRPVTDVEIDRREFNGRDLVLLEDRHRGMMKPDGTSKQYILAFAKKGGSYNKRFITDLMQKRGYANAKEGARAIFLHPEDFKPILGESFFSVPR